MTRRSDGDLVPRNGHGLAVGLVARISGCAKQKEASLEDQIDHGKEEVAELYEGLADYRIVSTKGKGERLDRPELAEIEALLRTRELDLLVMEDVGRLVRGADAVRLWGIAVDHGTRCIAPNDCLDTADENWEEDLLEACAQHVGHNIHTSRRLKKKLMNRFKKYGEITPCETYGYIKPEGSKTFDDWRKDDLATPIIQEGARRLKETLNCSAVADWFNRQGIPVGKYCRRKEWYGAMVRRFYANSILKGMPSRGNRCTVKHHETGRRISLKNPKGPIFWEASHLAHLDAVEFDELNALLDAKNDKHRRKHVNGADPRWRVSRKRTVFPGQYACCWYCGWHVVWGGNGVTENLMCSASRDWHCWHSIGFNGPLAVSRIVAAITQELYTLDGFDDQYRELIECAQQDRSMGSADRWKKLHSDEATLARDKDNVVSAIAEYGPRPMIKEKLQELDAREKELARERYHLEHLRQRQLVLPQSVVELRQGLEDNFCRLATESPEFGDLLKQLIPEFHVYSVRLVDGGHLLPRARIKLDLAGHVADTEHVPELKARLSRVLTIDLFEKPPQRERIREEAVSLAALNVPQRQIAARLREESPKPKVVQDALALDRLMREQGLDNPYRLVLEPPDDYSKLRRHKNPKYRFEQREGYEPPAI